MMGKRSTRAIVVVATLFTVAVSPGASQADNGTDTAALRGAVTTAGS